MNCVWLAKPTVLNERSGLPHLSIYLHNSSPKEGLSWRRDNCELEYVSGNADHWKFPPIVGRAEVITWPPSAGKTGRSTNSWGYRDLHTDLRNRNISFISFKPPFSTSINISREQIRYDWVTAERSYCDIGRRIQAHSTNESWGSLCCTLKQLFQASSQIPLWFS